MKKDHRSIKRKKGTKVSHKKGMPPGSLVYIGKEPSQSATIRLLQFNNNTISDQYIESTKELSIDETTKDIKWYQVNGLNDLEILKGIGERFSIDTLVLEDIVNTTHRPKLELFNDYLFFIMKTIEFRKETIELDKSHLCMIAGSHYLFTLHANNPQFFKPLETRIQTGKGKIKSKNYDYLLYAIIDMVVDSYFETIEAITEGMEEIEEAISEEPNRQSLIQLEKYRKVILKLRKTIVPMREIASETIRDEAGIIEGDNEKYFRDVYDHTLHLIENIDNLVEMNNSIKDLYHSTISFKMNQVMQVLTIYTVIFTPITFLAGIYGMNFINIPELQYKYGYFIAIGAMLLIVAGMFVFFKRRRWL